LDLPLCMIASDPHQITVIYRLFLRPTSGTIRLKKSLISDILLFI